MPYEGQFASKSAHSDFLRNPDIKDFLGECEYLTPPSDEEAQNMAGRFSEPPQTEVKFPLFVVAVDGSSYESSLGEKLPSTKVGYVQIGALLIDLGEFGSLRVGKFVDPFKVAELQDENSALTFSMPSANIKWGGKTNVRDSFRAAVDQQFSGLRTRFSENDPLTSLRSTLFNLASLRPGELGTGDPHRLKIFKCPDCGNGPVELEDIPDQQKCTFCGADVYPTDCLRIWEEVNDYQSNQIAISRLMLALEQLIPLHYMRYFYKNAPLLLSEMAFFVDGPLAVFGTPAHDDYAGDIRNASVTFVNRDASNAVLCTASVGLVSLADTKTGTATCNWNATITGDNSQSFTIGIIVNNYYTRNDSAEFTIVTVSKPIGSNFITGGGYIVLTNSAGLMAGTAGTKTNYGFNVKYNKNGTNLQGNINIIIRRLESDGIVHVYQIKGNAMTSLSVNPALCPKATATSPCTAVFNGKANIQDITDPLAPIAVDGNGTLQVTMTDKGEPGSSDSIAITLWNKAGGLWFSSNWNETGTMTTEKSLGGGNLVVH